VNLYKNYPTGILHVAESKTEQSKLESKNSQITSVCFCTSDASPFRQSPCNQFPYHCCCLAHNWCAPDL